MASGKKRRRQFGPRVTRKNRYIPDLFTEIRIVVPKTLIPTLLDKASSAGVSLEQVCAFPIYNFVALDWDRDTTEPPGIYSEHEDRQRVFNTIASIPKGISFDRLTMLEVDLKLNHQWIVIAVYELVLMGDLEFFDIDGQSVKGVRVVGIEKLRSRKFRRLAGEVQR